MVTEYIGARAYKTSYKRFQRVAKKTGKAVTRVIDEASKDIADKHGV